MTVPEGMLTRLRHVARIFGPNSASAKALEEYERRTAAGESVTIFDRGSHLLVGPPHRTEKREKHGG
ncbi:hypothetical protein J2Y58_002916 [Sphingomonas sp. BE138]|nr:hypothetical protein [Sphingomonas sp. BE138]